MNIKWNFPSNNNSGIEGLNDAGVETFSGKTYYSLGKEIIQNSLDASAFRGKKPVLVSFELIETDWTVLPGMEQFKDIINKCQEFWKPEQNQEPYKFFQNAEKLMNHKKVKILKVSDYNTTGLMDPGKERGIFNSLVKDSGRSNKGDTSGGSYGIGKSASYACSDLRMVFFNTLDIKGQKGFQGVSRLASHRGDEGVTRNIGYYGVVKGNTPVTDISSFPELFNRKESGTDIFIAAFNEQEGWEDELIESVISNFFLAVMDDRLNVKINGEMIDKNSIAEVMEKHFNNEDLGYQFYKALTEPGSENKIIFREENFRKMGEIELHILKDSKFKKRAAVVRNNGMRIVNYDRFQGAAPFSAVLLIKGDKLNTFLRKCENPSHDKFEAKRYKQDSKGADRTLKELRKWTGQRVKEVFIGSIGSKIEVKGIDRYLGSTAPSAAELKKTETLKKKVKKASIKAKKPKEPVKKPTGPKNKNFKLVKNRIVYNSQSENYRLLLQGTKDAQCYVKINIVSEEGSKEPALVHSASMDKKKIFGLISDALPVKHSGNMLGPIALTADKLAQIEITLAEKGKFAMEVLVKHEISK